MARRNPNRDLWLVRSGGMGDLFLVDPADLNTAALVTPTVEPKAAGYGKGYPPIGELLQTLADESGDRIADRREWHFVIADEVPAQNRGTVESRLADLAVRCAKLNYPSPIALFGPDRKVGERASGAFSYPKVAFAFRALLPAPMLPGGWILAAVLDFSLPSGKSLVYSKIRGPLPERFYADPQFCEHCRTNRNRKHVFVLRNNDGKWLKIGGTCTENYLGISPTALMASALWPMELEESLRGDDDEGGLYGYKRPRWYLLREYLATTASVIRHQGRYVSRKLASEILVVPTSEIAWDVMAPPKPDEEPKAMRAMRPEPQDFAVADVTLQWGADLPPTDDYRRNTRAVLSEEVITPKHMGFAAAAVAGYLKDAANQRMASASRDAAPLAIGDRITTRVKVVDRRTIDTVYGQTKLIKMLDADGRVLTTFASGEFDGRPDDEFAVTGTVKDVKEFRGVTETVLSRCVRWTDEGWAQHLEKEAKKAARAAKKK